MSSDLPVIETFKVTSVAYNDHVTKKENRTIRVMYICGVRAFYEYISIEGNGYAKHKAHDWWKQRHASEPPATIEEALQLTTELRQPTAIKVWVNRQYPEILGYEWH